MTIENVLVVMPVYNAVPYVGKAIESILNQTYTNFSFLIINDGSTDGSESVVKSYSDSRIIVWDQENRGPGAAMNRAIQYAHEKNYQLLARMDADDISMPDRLEKQISLLQKNPEAAACSANCYYIDAETELILGTSTVSGSPKLIRWEINHGLRGLIQGASTFRVEPLVQIGGYRPIFRTAEEVDLFMRLAEKYKLINSTDYLYKIRINNNSLSMHDERTNILYQFYASDCHKRSIKGKSNLSYETYKSTINLKKKFDVWREEQLLINWRKSLKTKNFSYRLLAGLIDPCRVIIRLIRNF